MATANATPWTTDRYAPERAAHELSPYRVDFGGTIYDQSAFTADTGHRYQAFIGGVGSGKTVGGLIRMAAHVTEWNPGSMGAIVTPTSYGIKNAILPKLERWGFLDTWDYKGPQSEAPGLHTPNGTRILLESANNERKIERLRGFDLAWFWLDEAAYVPERAWDVLTGRLRVGEYRNAFVTTTPAGYNWVYERFHPESDRQLQSLNAVLGVPSYANPHLPIDYREEILGEYEGRFYAQEVEGGFVQPAGLVYPWFDYESHVIDTVDANVRRVFYGVDWGFDPHPACILAIGHTTRGEYVVLGEHYEKRNTDLDLAKRATQMVEEYGHGPFYCDPSEPSNIETFERHGLDARKADNSVEPGIQRVTAHASDLRIVSTCQAVINEFGTYTYKEGSDEPVDKNDHAMDALRYGLLTDEGGPGTGIIGSDPTYL
jgi:PBSX family phage terminase large subunit